jgi:hypothetical protein
MADAVNGTARTAAAVLGARLDAVVERETECRTSNKADHEDLFDRMRALEVAIATLQTRVAFWAAAATAIASIIVQVAFKLWN